VLWRGRAVAGWPLLAQRLVLGFAAFSLVVAPWAVRNYMHWKSFIPFSTKASVNAWMHNHPGLEVSFGRAAIFGTNPTDIFSSEIQSVPNEADRAAALMNLFLEHLRDDPLHVAGLALVRLAIAVVPMPVTDRDAVTWLVALYAKGLTLLALVLMLVGRRRFPWQALSLYLLFAIFWLGIQSVAGPGLRYRIPAEVAWAVIVGTAVVSWSRSRGLRVLEGEWRSRHSA
jgi:hypothetical protein